ncbi:FAD-dependent monooxygenase [Zhihengliuella alba]|uniref:FAD-dependent monooxygenase n=1 Tax=Zhihengliuella alba TaxID=547018 RepID=A0ABP7DEP0_9MICC
MLHPLPVAEQCQRAADDDLRVLVVGAGIAGLTVAGLLRRRGHRPVVVERRREGADPGYMLALMPIVDAALEDLGARRAYRDASTPLRRYRVLSHRGVPLRTDDMTDIVGEYGDYRGIGRGPLVDILSHEGCDVAFGTTVTGLEEHDGGPVTVEFSTPGDAREPAATGRGSTTGEFDAVIVADGLHSGTRLLLPGPLATVDGVDTGWGGWVVWVGLDPSDEPAEEVTEPPGGGAGPGSDESASGTGADLGVELWGSGFFLGSYPVKGALGAFLGGPEELTAAGPEAYVERVRSELSTVTPRTGRLLRALQEAEDPFFWPLTDVRARRWASGRTVLLGDAAAGFLPTAGIGAGMAMESAWMLAGALDGAAAADVPQRLAAYEAAQRPRVEAAQDTSRRLARIMFRGGRLMAGLRDLAARATSVEVAVKPILRLLQHPADPGVFRR